MYEIFDEYCWKEHKKVITYEKHHVLGLKNFAHWNLSRAIPSTPLHHHSDIIEMHCLTKGKRYSQIDEQVYTITGNELFITYPYENHSNGNLAQTPCSFYGFQIDLKHEKELLGLNEEYSQLLCNSLRNLDSRHLKFSASEASLLKKSFNLFGEGRKESIALGLQYLCGFLFTLSKLEPVITEDIRTASKEIQRTLDYIEHNYKEALQLKELAKIAGYSLSRFKIKFKEEVGITPADFIIFRKVEYAKYLLKKTNTSITEIAFDAGFSSSNYFGTAFKRLSNLTPSQYRKFCNK